MSHEKDQLLNKDEYLTRLEQLTEALNAGQASRADTLLAELTVLRETELFHELGKLTREIHDSITQFSMDERVVELAQAEIPDAKERLNYVVTQTEQAAHRTMTDAETALDVVDDVNKTASGIRERWAKFRTESLSKSDFLALSDDIDRFLGTIDEESDKVRTQLTDIMMAQGYQDLTGQMIKQVVTMVQEIEEKLVRLVAISGAKLSEETAQQADNGETAVGPQLPNADKDKVASSQDEVDDLLASLGF